MTEKKLVELFKLWQERLGLGQWEIAVIVGGCESDGAYMENRRSVHYNKSRIHVQPWVLSNDPPDQVLTKDFTPEAVEQAVVHELLHCVTLQMSAVVEDDLGDQLHPGVHTVFAKSFSRQEELAIENLSVALVKAWPK